MKRNKKSNKIHLKKNMRFKEDNRYNIENTSATSELEVRIKNNCRILVLKKETAVIIVESPSLINYYRIN